MYSGKVSIRTWLELRLERKEQRRHEVTWNDQTGNSKCKDLRQECSLCVQGTAKSVVWPQQNESGADKIKRGCEWRPAVDCKKVMEDCGFYSEVGSHWSVLNREVTCCDICFRRITLPAAGKLDCRMIGWKQNTRRQFYVYVSLRDDHCYHLADNKGN